MSHESVDVRLTCAQPHRTFSTFEVIGTLCKQRSVGPDLASMLERYAIFQENLR